ncbi:type IV pilus inner membrane component PilO [Cupriavidus pampae]|uniref:Pilus assembly protein PilO n=1 Tax=Cupriavidus pampae TaxID=659251 RepID=A0ABM8WVD6_9BURK|nr:type 4a pilus biogenesis protein PilO [Cupriavidus pampae]CAG9171461.1 hypothetical protein LMG32289_02374 [Cupriavidus pampae]
MRIPPNIAAPVAELVAQFRDLDVTDLASWQRVPRMLLSLAAGLTCFAAGWMALIGDDMDTLRRQRAEHEALLESYRVRVKQVTNLPVLRARKEEVALRVAAAERQLPGRTDMDALLADINHAGLLRSLQFELFKPESARAGKSFAEIPIRIRVNGRFTDLAGFSADLATMSRIVSMRDLNMQQDKTRGLAMEADVIAYRLLDAAESAAKPEDASTTVAGARK